MGAGIRFALKHQTGEPEAIGMRGRYYAAPTLRTWPLWPT